MTHCPTVKPPPRLPRARAIIMRFIEDCRFGKTACSVVIGPCTRQQARTLVRAAKFLAMDEREQVEVGAQILVQRLAGFHPDMEDARDAIRAVLTAILGKSAAVQDQPVQVRTVLGKRGRR